MANIKISEMTPDASVGGGELIPVSDAGSPKSVTVTNIKNFVVDAIEAISAGTAVSGSDGIFILQGGALKPVDIDVVAQHAIDTIWGKAAEASPASDDKLPLKDDADVEKTVTYEVLAGAVRATIEAAILDISDLADGSGALTGTDMMLVTQGTTGKRVTLTQVSNAVLAALQAYVTALSAVTVSASADVFYVIQGGVQKKVTLSTIAAYFGDPPSAPATTTADGIPQWSNATGDLKDGLTLATTVEDPGLDTRVPSEKAVRTAIDTPVGFAEMFIPATAMVGSYTDGAGETAGEALYLAEYTTNDITHAVHLFDGTIQDESTEWDMVMPADWNRGPIRFKAYWAPGDAAANAGEWIKLTLAAGARSDTDALDAALGTGVDVTDQAIADNNLHVTAESEELTVGGTPALGDMVHFKLTRDWNYAGVGAAMDVTLRLFGILIQYEKAYEVQGWGST